MKMLKETSKKLYVKDFNKDVLTTTIIDKDTQLKSTKEELMMIEPHHLKKKIIVTRL